MVICTANCLMVRDDNDDDNDGEAVDGVDCDEAANVGQG